MSAVALICIIIIRNFDIIWDFDKWPPSRGLILQTDVEVFFVVVLVVVSGVTMRLTIHLSHNP